MVVQEGVWVLVQYGHSFCSKSFGCYLLLYFKPRCISFLIGAGPPQYPLEREKVVSSHQSHICMCKRGGGERCFTPLWYFHLLRNARGLSWRISFALARLFQLGQWLLFCKIQYCSCTSPVTSKECLKLKFTVQLLFLKELVIQNR